MSIKFLLSKLKVFKSTLSKLKVLKRCLLKLGVYGALFALLIIQTAQAHNQVQGQDKVQPLDENKNIVPQRTLWDKTPIRIGLSIDQERLIHFPEHVRYWLPAHVQSKINILAANGVLYITAKQAFDPVRIRVQAMDSQRLYLLDLQAEQGERLPALIVMNKDPHRASDKPSNSPPPKQGDWYVRLIRHAAQSLYSPERLMPADRDIQSVNTAREGPQPLLRGGDIEATLVQSWRGGGYTLSAVRVRNLSQQTINIVHVLNSRILDDQGLNKQSSKSTNTRHLVLSRDVRGQWLAVSAQHHHLSPAGSHQDRSTLYLISQGSFEEAL